jgi:hypothetical protein
MKKILLLLTLALCAQMTFAQTVPTYVPTVGLVGYWGFNGNANDQSGNGNNGTVNGATLTTDRNGIQNSTYTFGAGNFIQTNNLILNCINNFSYSTWVNSLSPIIIPLEDVQTGISSQCVIHPTHGACFGPEQTNSGAGLYVGNNGVVVIEHSHLYVRTALVYEGAISNWNLITVIYENKVPKLYIDGQYIKTGIADFRDVHPSSGFDNTNYADYSKSGFGSSFNGQSNQGIFFNGQLDDIAIYNRVLTQEEITQLYYADNTCQSLVINTGVLSFNPPTYNNTVTMYPNPANDHITIDCGNLANVSGWSIKIFNALGQEVFSGTMNTQQYVVPLNTWSGQGVYFVKIYDASNQLMNTKKIILQ